MSEERHLNENGQQEPGLFKKFPKLSIILIAFIAYGLLFAMCAVIAVLLIRG